jgi:hypothetical protein
LFDIGHWELVIKLDMFSLIPQIILLLCFGLIIWLIIKNLPKVKDERDGHAIEINVFPEKGKKLIHKIPIEKIDAKVNSFLEKAIRRSRIILMKVDTYLQKHLNTLKNHSKPKSIFKVGDNLIAKEEMDLIDEVQEIQNQASENYKEEIDLIAGVDKTIEELLPEEKVIDSPEDEVEVLVIGQEDVIKKFDLEPEAEVVEHTKKRKKNRV